METIEKKPDTKSEDWQAMSEYWTQVTDIVDGRAAVIAGGETYLPKFTNESGDDYNFRLKTAKFTNVYRDIIEGLAQKPFAHELQVGDENTPSRITDLVEDIDGRGNHLHVFAGETFFNGINKSIDWILVDYTESAGLRTVADERAAGVRPYWVHIPAQNVIWIESEIIEGREQFTLVKILETPKQVRTFWRLDGKAAKAQNLGDGGAVVMWKVEQLNDYGVWVVNKQAQLTINEIPMVPFVTGRRKGTKWQFNPPMRDAADLQIELYQQETALKYIKTGTCFPMLAGNGVMPDKDASGKVKPVPVGPLAVLYAPPNAEGNHGTWEWIGTDASTLKFLADDIKDTIKELRELGRQPLTASSGNLTVITTRVAAAKGNSAVQAWALLLKDALENALRLTTLWLNEAVAPTVTIYTDFAVEDADSKSPEHLMKMREKGDLSLSTLWKEFRRREILGPEFDEEDELENLLNETPSEEESGFATGDGDGDGDGDGVTTGDDIDTVDDDTLVT